MIRFAGCQLAVSKNADWFEGKKPQTVERIFVKEPPRETINLAGVGEVAVTRHVLDRLSARLYPDSKPGKTTGSVWKELNRLTADRSVREVTRCSLWALAARGTQEGRYFINDSQGLVLVVTDNPGEGRRLVTAYPATSQFQEKAGVPRCAEHGERSQI